MDNETISLSGNNHQFPEGKHKPISLSQMFKALLTVVALKTERR